MLTCHTRDPPIASFHCFYFFTEFNVLFRKKSSSSHCICIVYNKWTYCEGSKLGRSSVNDVIHGMTLRYLFTAELSPLSEIKVNSLYLNNLSRDFSSGDHAMWKRDRFAQVTLKLSYWQLWKTYLYLILIHSAKQLLSACLLEKKLHSNPKWGKFECLLATRKLNCKTLFVVRYECKKITLHQKMWWRPLIYWLETRSIMFGILVCITNMIAGGWGCVTKCKWEKVTVQQNMHNKKLCIKNSKGGGNSSDSKCK